MARDVSILSSLTICWNLETLLLSSREGGELPITLWDMVKLRHLHIPRCTIPKNSKELKDLKTLSTPYFSCARDAELILSRTPNLQELRCSVLGTSNFKKSKYNFPTGIETLKIHGKNGPYVFPFCISTSNLRNLTVDDFYLHPRQILAIGLLQNLQVLKLRRIIFLEKGWKIRNGKFPQLKVLKLLRVNFSGQWIVDDAFPYLERLVLHDCHSLKEIPSCFDDISSLKSIEVRGCEESVGNSARNIKEQVDLYGSRPGIQVLIINERENRHSAPIVDYENDDDDDDEEDDDVLDDDEEDDVVDDDDDDDDDEDVIDDEDDDDEDV